MPLIQIDNRNTPASLDVREIAPRERHPLILGTFDLLAPGESFILVNDHDPKPLYYQFKAEHPGQVEWTYLEQGPEVWRVRFGRMPDLAATPILELVARYPRFKEILDAFGLDTCCGGHFSVAEAAIQDGIALQPVLEALRAALNEEPHGERTA
jgi:uncharacterized protein (DUF2249 family)